MKKIYILLYAVFVALECDRWFDIVRTGQMTTVFPGIAAYRQLYPIPQTEIENVSDKGGWQNEGYTVVINKLSWRDNSPGF